MAKITQRCKECGNEFEHRKKCYNSKDRESYEAWATNNITICPECYTKRKRQEEREKREKFYAEYGIPAITAGTEKQIAYANKLRDEYFERHEREYRYFIECLKSAAQEDIEREAKELGYTVDEYIAEAYRGCGLSAAHKLNDLTNAGEIIDLLLKAQQ